MSGVVGVSGVVAESGVVGVSGVVVVSGVVDVKWSGVVAVSGVVVVSGVVGVKWSGVVAVSGVVAESGVVGVKWRLCCLMFSVEIYKKLFLFGEESNNCQLSFEVSDQNVTILVHPHSHNDPPSPSPFTPLPRDIDMGEFLSRDPEVRKQHPQTKYNLVANICHDGQAGERESVC